MTFRVQYISGTMPASQSQVTLTAPTNFSALGALTRAFVLPATSMPTVAVGTSNDSPQLRNWLMHCVLSDTSTIIIDRGANPGSTADYAFYIIEYIGAAGGANEFIVRGRRTSLLNAGTTAQNSTTISDVVTLAKCVPFVTALYSDSNTSSLRNFMLDATVLASGTGHVVRYERFLSDHTVIYTAYCVEFTGSNWNVQSGAIDFTLANTDKDATISAVASMNKTWLQTYYMATDGGSGPAAGTSYARLASSTLVRARVLAAGAGPRLRFYAIQNADAAFNVQRLDAINGTADWSGGSGGDQTESLTTSITSESGVFVHGQAGSNNTQINNNPASLWRFRRSSATAIEAFRKNSVGGTEYAVQVVSLPADTVSSLTLSPTPSVLSVAGLIVGQPLAISPQTMVFVLTSLPQPSTVTREPAAAVLTLTGGQLIVHAVYPNVAQLSLSQLVSGLHTTAVISPVMPPLDYSQPAGPVPTVIVGGGASPATAALSLQSLLQFVFEGGDILVRSPAVGSVSLLGLAPLPGIINAVPGTGIGIAGLTPSIADLQAIVEPGAALTTISGGDIGAGVFKPFQWIDVDPGDTVVWS